MATRLAGLDTLHAPDPMLTRPSEAAAPRRPLAVFTPIVGRWGQPWLKAHMEDILPGRTVVVAICAYEPSGPCWDVDAPMLYVPPHLPSVFRNQPCDRTHVERLPEGHRTVFWSAAHTDRIRTFLTAHRVEVILAQWLDATLPLVAVSRELGLRYYCQAHGTDITAGLKNDGVRRAYEAYNGVNAVVAPSEFGRRQLLQVGLDAERTYVVRHAVDLPARPMAHESGPVRCLAAGRLDPMKGPTLVIDAFRRALERCPDVFLDYVGDGEMMPAVRQRIREFAIEDRVALHGFLPHGLVLEMMKRSHILLQPSVAVDNRYDTCPVTVAEAMANGLAVVASRHGGIPEQIVDGESGLLVDEYDTQAMGDRIVTLSSDPALRNRLGRAAWLRAREMFSVGTVRAQWLDLLGLSRYAEENLSPARESP